MRSPRCGRSARARRPGVAPTPRRPAARRAQPGPPRARLGVLFRRMPASRRAYTGRVRPGGARVRHTELDRAELAPEVLVELRVAVRGRHGEIAEQPLEPLAVLDRAGADRAEQVVLDRLP